MTLSTKPYPRFFCLFLFIAIVFVVFATKKTNMQIQFRRACHVCAIDIWLLPVQVVYCQNSYSPEDLLSSRHHLALVFRQHRAAGVEKSPPQLLIIRGGHRQHPTPTPAFVFSIYKLSGKLLKGRNRGRSPFVKSPLAHLKFRRGWMLMSRFGTLTRITRDDRVLEDNPTLPFTTAPELFADPGRCGVE